MTWPKVVELDTPKMKGQFLVLGPMSKLNNKKNDFFNKPNPLDYVET
jgi:hypothetical protein